MTSHTCIRTCRAARQELRASASPARALVLSRYFKTGPGEYGAGDMFLGLTVPQLRRIAGRCTGIPMKYLPGLLRSRVHEDRALALFLLVNHAQRGDGAIRETVLTMYLSHTRFVNNWDLVDLSAPEIVGSYLLSRPKKLLDTLARSDLLWERRIAIVATYTLIRSGHYTTTLRLTRLLAGDPHDLIHKACGWMLREVGKRDRATLTGFLDRYGATLPRTTLRYAIERFPEKERRGYLERTSRRVQQPRRQRREAA